MAINLIPGLVVLAVTNASTAVVGWYRGRKIGRRQIVQASARADGVFNLKEEDADTIGSNLMQQDRRLEEQQQRSEEIDKQQEETKKLMDEHQKEVTGSPTSTTLTELVKVKGKPEAKGKKGKKAA